MVGQRPNWDAPLPLATMLGDIPEGVEHVQVRDAHVAALHWQKWRNTFVLRRGQFHP